MATVLITGTSGFIGRAHAQSMARTHDDSSARSSPVRRASLHARVATPPKLPATSDGKIMRQHWLWTLLLSTDARHCAWSLATGAGAQS